MSQSIVGHRTSSKNLHFRFPLPAGTAPQQLGQFPWSTVSEFKHRIAKLFKTPSQNCPNGDSAALNKTSGELPKPTEKHPLKIDLDFSTGAVFPSLPAGLSARLTDDGTAGTYIITTPAHKPVGVFKPIDEEPFAPMNPRGFQGKTGSPGFRPGVKSGEAAYREVAAYLLDHFHFSSVPYTTLAESSDTAYNNGDTAGVKLGSFQSFVSHIGCAEDFAPCKFNKEAVHKIGILDIRLLNMDRNTGNVLVGRDMDLIPIDHGMTLPDCIEIDADDICWMGWKLAKEPFTAKTLEYISKIDLQDDLHTVRSMVSNDSSLKNMRAAGLLLKKAAARGLTLYEIGSLIYRKNEEASVLEKIVKKAEKSYFSAKRAQLNRLKSRVCDLSDENDCSIDTQDTSTDSLTKEGEFSEPLVQRSISFTTDKDPATDKAFDDKLFDLIGLYIEQAIAKFLNGKTGRLRSYKGNFDSK